MGVLDTRALFDSLLGCRTRAEVLTVLTTLGDDGGVGIEQSFGPHGLKWVAFGDNPSNNSTIGLASKPGKSLTERITNAMDALLEERAAQGTSKTLPDSPRAAAQQWFGRRVSGPDTGLFQYLNDPNMGKPTGRTATQGQAYARWNFGLNSDRNRWGNYRSTKNRIHLGSRGASKQRKCGED